MGGAVEKSPWQYTDFYNDSSTDSFVDAYRIFTPLSTSIFFPQRGLVKNANEEILFIRHSIVTSPEQSGRNS
ncbi:MAG: hypothetical protein WBE68_26870 [Candidatus Nitrosopolaris sp.]